MDTEHNNDTTLNNNISQNGRKMKLVQIDTLPLKEQVAEFLNGYSDSLISISEE